MDEALHKLTDIEPMDDGFGFTLIDSEGEPLVSFVYDTKQDAQHGAKVMRAAMEKAVGVSPTGPF